MRRRRATSFESQSTWDPFNSKSKTGSDPSRDKNTEESWNPFAEDLMKMDGNNDLSNKGNQMKQRPRTHDTKNNVTNERDPFITKMGVKQRPMSGRSKTPPARCPSGREKINTKKTGERAKISTQYWKIKGGGNTQGSLAHFMNRQLGVRATGNSGLRKTRSNKNEHERRPMTISQQQVKAAKNLGSVFMLGAKDQLTGKIVLPSKLNQKGKKNK
eukprot:jgi/Bigna1/129602/aug1.9_g4310